MPRDYEKYVYWTIAIKKDGDIHKAITRDAEDSGAESHVPIMLTLRLEEYYRLKAAGLLLYRSESHTQLETKAGTIETMAISVVDEDQAAANLDEADDYFS